MTTEREQLILAAKACGYSVRFVIGKYAKNDNLGSFMINHGTSNERRWNPKHDDGDCARMEAQLSVCVEWSEAWVISWHGNVQQTVLFSTHNGDKSAARRAASVAVASEIGRNFVMANHPPGNWIGATPSQMLTEIDELRADNARLRSALKKVAELDPEVDSDEGYNEWGQADCFRQARDAARAALGEKS